MEGRWHPVRGVSDFPSFGTSPIARCIVSTYSTFARKREDTLWYPLFLCKTGNMVLLGQHGERILSGKQLYHTHRAADFSMTVDMACFQRGTGFLRFSKVY